MPQEAFANEELIGPIAERVGVLSAQIHALNAELVDALVELDGLDSWKGWGVRSFPHWLSVKAGWSASDGRCFGSTWAGGPPPDLAAPLHVSPPDGRPLRLVDPPDVDGDTPKPLGRGWPLTACALDTYIHGLMTA